ncbi:MAG: S41 family peptidase [Pirellulaceae bacterium]
MPRRILHHSWTTRWLSLAILALLIGSAGQPAHAQIRIPDAARLDSSAVREILANGEQLERQGRWGEALSFYEDAVRNHGEDQALKHKLDLARLHYEVSRRYSDNSYVRSLTEMDRDQTLKLYDEVLRKIEASYVDAPHWSVVCHQGLKQLDIALQEPQFLAKNTPHSKPGQIDAVRKLLAEHVDWQRVSSPYQAIEKANYAAELMQQNLGVTPTATILEFVCGAAGSLDPYTNFLTQDQLNEVYSQIEGNFVGLGVELKADEGSLLIVHAIEGSPAAQAGILDGDRILGVDGQMIDDQITTEKAADMLKGVAGSHVKVKIVTGDQPPRNLIVRRDRVDVPSVNSIRIIDKDSGVGYLRISSFQKGTAQSLNTAMWKLHRDGMRALVIDLRGNPGGLLTAAVDMADLFLETGTIVSTRGRSTQEDFDYTAHSPGTWRVPLVVLIDNDSASASEIFAGAIHDHQRGTIVGQTSYGKGSVQGIFPLGTAGAGLRLTTAKFYSPSGQPISFRGVTPNVEVQLAAKPVGGEQPVALSNDQDVTYEAGITAAKNLLGIRGISGRPSEQR